MVVTGSNGETDVKSDTDPRYSKGVWFGDRNRKSGSCQGFQSLLVHDPDRPVTRGSGFVATVNNPGPVPRLSTDGPDREVEGRTGLEEGGAGESGFGSEVPVDVDGPLRLSVSFSFGVADPRRCLPDPELKSISLEVTPFSRGPGTLRV